MGIAIQLLFSVCTEYSMWEISGVLLKSFLGSTEPAKLASEDMG